MISFIKGEIIQKLTDKIIIENNNIGFEIFCSIATLASIGLQGETCLIYTYMQVKEDEISLIGFSSLEEKNLFELLISVNGIGSKLALGILSGMKTTDLIVSIASGDTYILSKIKGLGKKTAERLVLELQDKVSPGGVTPLETGYIIDNQDAIDQAYEVLISLGINKNDAMKMARTYSAGTNSAEEIISKALKNMGR